MTFLDIYSIRREYRSTNHNVVDEFYVPLLSQSILYKRAVAYFSSSALIQITKGLSKFIKNNGKMQLIVSPQLSNEDIEDIEKGYELRRKVEENILNSITSPQSEEESERLSWISYMVSINTLDIKIALLSTQDKGIYHEKVGIFYDNEGNRVAFSGSSNETYSAFFNNYESFDVYCSWKSEDNERVCDKELAFDRLWKNQESKMIVMDFPEAAKKKLLSYRNSISPNFDIESDTIINDPSHSINQPCVPEFIKLHEYQNEAINNWKVNDYKGIFDMATGTGKTITGLAGIVDLYKHKKKCAVIIVCPYQHLVEQWVEDILKFNITPVIGYSSSNQKDWKQRLKDSIIDYNIGILDFICFVTTNATFKSEFVQFELARIKTNKTLVVDEAHNFGAAKISLLLDSTYSYRLALSATIERHNDPEGTQLLLDFFGKKCIEYDIERAIKEKKLTPYYYYPSLVYLEEYEYDKYIKISKRISKAQLIDKEGKLLNQEQVKLLLIKRSRIIAGAVNKISKLKELIKPFEDDSHILVYCGATRIQLDDTSLDEFGERQIVEVSKMLGNDLNIINSHFTSNENSSERELIKEKFAKNDPYQVLVAIKCLDEGVNIPSIKTAFILASSTNPKEYIQRRGRVLRTFPGKSYAKIFDFITLPHVPETVQNLDDTEKKYDISLIKKEIERMKEFGRISMNPEASDIIIDTLVKAYNLDLLKEDEEFGKEIK